MNRIEDLRNQRVIHYLEPHEMTKPELQVALNNSIHTTNVLEIMNLRNENRMKEIKKQMELRRLVLVSH